MKEDQEEAAKKSVHISKAHLHKGGKDKGKRRNAGLDAGANTGGGV